MSPLPPPLRHVVAPPPPAVAADPLPPGLVRAYTLFGAAADAGAPEPALGGDAAAWAGAARRLLAAQPWRRGKGQAVGGGGMRMILAPPAWLAATTVEPSGAPPSPAATSRRPMPMRGEGLVRELVAPGDCIAIRFDPATAGDRDLLLIDRTGSYAVRIETGEAADVRLDGGLVVQGRCYRIGHQARITALGGAVGVQVLPTDAAPVLWDAPAHPLANDG